MKKDNPNMITTFKVFETVGDGIKPSYLMTLSEYQKKVSPVLKSFYKFINKNEDYLRRGSFSYGGVLYLDFDEYVAEEKERWSKKRKESWEKEKTWDESFDKEYTIKKWLNHPPIPKEIKNIYKEYKDFFTLVFGEKNLGKMESDETKSNKRSLRRAIEDDTYLNLLKNKELTVEKLTEIFESVGVNIPVGLLKKVNIKPIVKKIEKTPEEITKFFNYTKRSLTDFKNKKISPYFLTTRMTKTTEISYAMVYSFKSIVDNWNYFSNEQKQEIENEFPNYVTQIKKFVAKGDAKGGIVDIDLDKVFWPIIQKFKEGIQPLIDEYKIKISERTHEVYLSVHNNRKKMTNDEFKKYYGTPIRSSGFFNGKYENKLTGEYSMTKFWESELGKFLRIPLTDETKLEDIIKEKQEIYQNSEYEKINSLFYRLRVKYPTLIDFKLDAPVRGRNGVEFYMKAWDSKEIEYTILTETIVAGGYNIQRLHFRWLMSVYCGEDKVAIFNSEK